MYHHYYHSNLSLLSSNCLLIWATFSPRLNLKTVWTCKVKIIFRFWLLSHMFSCLAYGNEPIGQAGKWIVDGPQKDIWCPSCSRLSSHLDSSVPRGYAHSMSGHIIVTFLHFFIKLYIFLCFSNLIFFLLIKYLLSGLVRSLRRENGNRGFVVGGRNRQKMCSFESI